MITLWDSWIFAGSHYHANYLSYVVWTISILLRKHWLLRAWFRRRKAARRDCSLEGSLRWCCYSIHTSECESIFGWKWERHWRLFSLENMLLLFSQPASTFDDIIYLLAVLVVALSYCRSDWLKLDSERRMVHPITCQVFFVAALLQ